MLQHIHIQNFNVIEKLSLDFAAGFNVLTGETGAGKSIWVDAVHLALGGRAEANLISPGKDKCDITLCFDIRNLKRVQKWLQENQLSSEDPEECLIRRIITLNNPSRTTINGTPCPQQQVRELADLLISIHSQHQHHALLKKEIQQMRVDNYGGHSDMLQPIKQIYQQWHEINTQLTQLKNQAEKRDAELALLRYQLEEIQSLALTENEWDELFRQHQQMHAAKDILQNIGLALELAQEKDASITEQLNQTLACIASALPKASELSSAQELFNTAAIHIQEACAELQQFRDRLDLSPEQLQQIESRLTLIHDMARKHHVKPEDLTNVEKILQDKINSLETIDQQIQQLAEKQDLLVQEYQQCAQQLTSKRKKTAQKLNPIISKYMQLLGMEGGQFRVKLEAQDTPLHPQGNEKLSFEVITNPGHDFQALNKVVSGGELSRISLALQVITAAKDEIPTLIFDEVDVGIGGKTADIVGKLLRQLGTQSQVLCITHLPQIAALGHEHFKAQKQIIHKKTQFDIEKLGDKERLEELARMLGGQSITAQTKAHAAEMLKASRAKDQPSEILI